MFSVPSPFAWAVAGLATWTGKLSWAPGEGLGNMVGVAGLIETIVAETGIRTGPRAHAYITVHITQQTLKYADR